MSDVRIFSKVNKKSQVSIYAKTGNINTLSNAFLLTLYNGEIHDKQFLILLHQGKRLMATPLFIGNHANKKGVAS